MARATTKEKKPKIRKQDAPRKFDDDVDYRIAQMGHYEGFQYADILVIERNEYIRVHNRFGAWFIGDPAADRGTAMGDLKHSVCAALQDFRRRWLNDNPTYDEPPAGFTDASEELVVAVAPDNVFVQLVEDEKPNVFLAENPFM